MAKTESAIDRNYKASKKKTKESTSIPVPAIIVFAVIILVAILAGFFILKVPVVPLCIIAVLEVVICASLRYAPLWVNIIIVVAQIVAGFITDQLIFVILMCIVYALGVSFFATYSQVNKNEGLY